MSTKNPMTLARIEPATFRFVAQHINHCATAVPFVQNNTKIMYRRRKKGRKNLEFDRTVADVAELCGRK